MNSVIEEFKNMFSFENVKWDAVFEATYETIYMTVIATIAAFIIGLIFGIILFLSNKSENVPSKPLYGTTSFIVNLFRAIPF